MNTLLTVLLYDFQLWSMDVIMKKCQNRLDEAAKKMSSLQQLLEPPDRPYNHGEGAMETTSITVSRSACNRIICK